MPSARSISDVTASIGTTGSLVARPNVDRLVAFAAGEAEVPEGDALRSESEHVGSATSAPTTPRA